MRSSTHPTACLLLAGVLAAAPGIDPAPARAASESSEDIKGIVERVETGRFLVDSAWVEPGRRARFRGDARNVSRIRVEDWADVDGRWSKGGVFVADRIKIRREFPGNSFQPNLEKQGLQEATKLEKSKNAYTDPEVLAYVRRIGDGVIPEWARRQFRFQFRVVSDPTLNAFALPDGSIFVHTGLLARVENDAQLAAILGHEVAHVTERHAAQGYKKQLTTFVPAILGAQVLGIKVSEQTENPFLQVATQLGLTLAVSAAVSGYGRTHEDQADRVGLRYAVEAGYDPADAPRVWEIFNETYGDQSQIENFFYGNHSTNQVRKRNQEREIRRHYSDPDRPPAGQPTNSDAYQRAMLNLTRTNAVLDFEAKRHGLAKAGFERVLRHRPADALALTYLGRIAWAVEDDPGRSARAETLFRKAIAAEPGFPDAHRELGRLLAAGGKKTEARSALQKYLDLAPTDAKDRKDVEKEIRKLS
jgi:predicted Zn-dependent protease